MEKTAQGEESASTVRKSALFAALGKADGENQTNDSKKGGL